MMNKELIRIAVIALIFFGIGAAAAESNLNTFTLRADRVLAGYIGGNVTVDEVNITGLMIKAGQVLGYYNESVTDTLLAGKFNSSNHTKATHDALGINADTLDGINSTQFERTDTNWTINTTLSADTVYRNGASRALLLVYATGVGVTRGDSLNVKILTDSSNPPTTEKARLYHYHYANVGPETSTNGQSVTVPIQPNDYYNIEVTTGTLTRAELFY